MILVRAYCHTALNQGLCVRCSSHCAVTLLTRWQVGEGDEDGSSTQWVSSDGGDKFYKARAELTIR